MIERMFMGKGKDQPAREKRKPKQKKEKPAKSYKVDCK